MYGGKKVESSAMNAHKAMAGAGSSGSFGVGAFPSRDAKHPDASMSHEAMPDSARGAPPAMGGSKGAHGRQAAPDHGPMGNDHFMRGGKL